MTNTELRINGVLMDTAADIAVRLNRQLINPGELNTKDAQYSYSISLPPTANNHAAFNYANVEETKNKFNREYNAELVINSVRVFNGKFRLSSIKKDGYKGNLYIPAQKSIKDIFGELKLNANPELRIPFSDFVASVNGYNNAAAGEPQYAIFPYVLYGVLPKVPLNKNANTYSARNVWDDSVRVGMQDLAPSINPLLMLRHIFNAQGYTLLGDAFDDEKLAKLYMSYKNADTYVQPWNYGQQAKIHVHGIWSSRYNQRAGNERLERGINQGSDLTGAVYAVDLLDATNTKLTILEDTGGNVLYKEVNDADNVPWINGQIRIPTSGFYKVRFNASLQVYSWNKWRTTDPATGVQHMGGTSQHHSNDFGSNNYEVRLSRDRGSAGFGLSSPKLNNTYFYDNQPQNQTYDADNSPKYFPQVYSTVQTNFVDLAQDQYHLLGFAFGWRNNYATDEQRRQYRNPQDTQGWLGVINAAKPSTSWQAAQNTITPTRLAIQSPGYWKYGVIGAFGDDDDNPNANIDYSGGTFVNNKHFDANGNPVDPTTPGADDGNVILQRFEINRYFQYTIDAQDTTYTGNAYIHNVTGPPILIVPFVNGVATFDTTPMTGRIYVSFYTKIGTTYTGNPKLSKNVNDDESDVVGWELTDKYKIQLNNAPDNYSIRGRYEGTSGWDGNWFAQGEANAVVWLEAGELLTVSTVSAEGRYRNNGMHTTHGFVSQYIDFDLSVQPFRVDESWLQVSLSGNGTGAMNWNDPVNFDTDSINLVGFLSADMKTDDFIDNFCKAFNLNLAQLDAKTFSLDIKQSKTAVSNQYIDLDPIASIVDRENTPLGLPSVYKIGFTVDVDEQGYLESDGEDGGGQFETGVSDGDVVEQKSSFSYNWYKSITKTNNSGSPVLRLPLISKADVWAASLSYAEAMKKRYTDQAYRFWYYGGLLNDLGATFDFNGVGLQIARVREDLPLRSILTYHNEQFTILSNYFTLLINGASHYTEVEAYLTPMDYQRLNGAVLARFNGDMYYVAELSGFDPAARNKTKIKLIRKI